MYVDTLNKKGTVGSSSFFSLCAGHGANLTGESPVTGIYRQV